MRDSKFVQAVKNGTAPHFHHADHLRLTWILLQTGDAKTTMEEVRSTIRVFAGRHGQLRKYHETITRFWVDTVAYATRLHPEAATIDDLLSAAPHLLDKRLPWRHWSDEMLMSDGAREAWIPPDMIPLPWSDARLGPAQGLS